MKLKVLSVFDAAASAFNRPIFVPAIGMALRSFTDEVNRKAEGNDMNKHAADFALYEFGDFDDSVGLFQLLDQPKMLVRGSDVLNPET